MVLAAAASASASVRIPCERYGITCIERELSEPSSIFAVATEARPASITDANTSPSAIRRNQRCLLRYDMLLLLLLTACLSQLDGGARRLLPGSDTTPPPAR